MNKLDEYFHGYTKLLRSRKGLPFSVALLLFFLLFFNSYATKANTIGYILVIVRVILVFSALYALVYLIIRKLR